ncbi:MAG: hypothetical protein ACLTS6_13055 [Anaerobutyricum sp.]
MAAGDSCDERTWPCNADSDYVLSTMPPRTSCRKKPIDAGPGKMWMIATMMCGIQQPLFSVIVRVNAKKAGTILRLNFYKNIRRSFSFKRAGGRNGL